MGHCLEWYSDSSYNYVVIHWFKKLSQKGNHFKEVAMINFTSDEL